MRHLLIAESQLRAMQHVDMLEKAGLFFITSRGSTFTGFGYWQIRLPHGRHDEIKYMSHEHDAPWAENVGNIFRESNSFSTDESFYYARRTVSWTHDPFTAHWASFTKDAYINFSPQPETEVIVRCMESINDLRIREQ